MKNSKRKCVWCNVHKYDITDDHVFPRSIGGTKKLSVPACTKCQLIISKAEYELSRKSSYALCLVESGPRRRHKQKPTSGLIQTNYVIVQHPDGGYCESQFRSGESPRSLAYIEIDVANGCKTARIRGADPQDTHKLIEAFKQKLSSKPDTSGLVTEIATYTHNLGNINNDPDFWPRIVLDTRGRLFIRARNPEEAMIFIKAFVYYTNAGAFTEQSNWKNSEIKGGDLHHVSVEYDNCMVQRVIAKIATGLLFAHKDIETIDLSRFDNIRNFILGENDDGYNKIVKDLVWPGVMLNWPEHHVAAVFRKEDEILGLISIYGSIHSISLLHSSPLMPELRPMAAKTAHNGSGTEILNEIEALGIINILSNKLVESGSLVSPICP